MGDNRTMSENIENKLATVKYNCDTHCHLHPNQADCLVCENRCCEIVCPAHVYEWSEERQELLVNFENCLECGACKIACEKKSLGWEYPKGTKGVTFKQG